MTEELKTSRNFTATEVEQNIQDYTKEFVQRQREKYADEVDPEHALAMQAIGFWRQALDPHRERLQKLIDAERSMHDFGGLIDPTMYRDMLYSKDFQLQIRMAKAALTFLKELDAVASEIESEQAV